MATASISIDSSLSPVLDFHASHYSFKLKTNNEEGRPFNKLFKVGSCGVNLENLIYEVGTSDKFYTFELSDYVQDDQQYDHEDEFNDGDEKPYLRYF